MFVWGGYGVSVLATVHHLSSTISLNFLFFNWLIIFPINFIIIWSIKSKKKKNSERRSELSKPKDIPDV